jgi:hypothetical protein
VAKKDRDPAELAAAVEAGVARGMDIVDAFRSALDRAPSRMHRALEREHRKSVAAQLKARRRYEALLKANTMTNRLGFVVAGGAGVITVVDLIAEGGGGAGAPAPAWLWLGITGVAALVAARAGRRKKTLLPPEDVPIPELPPVPLARGSIGAHEVSHLIRVRIQIAQVSTTIERLHPGAGRELRQADAEASPALQALAERLRVLDQLRRDLPGSAAAVSATTAANAVRARLQDGCRTYDDLLAAAATLLAAPDTSRSTTTILGPAIDAMIAYAHGLERAADL